MNNQEENSSLPKPSAFTFHPSSLSSLLTGRENIYNKGAVLGFSKQEIDEKFDAIVEFAELENFIDILV
ncbi:MAG: hypothetical protein EOL88_12090 [Bacteroidia bacterium]|nr:hypothetical protein [Bacteroidia bacterium]